MMDDRALVETLRSGDPKAPGLLLDRFHGVVFGLCFRMMRHRQDAEDVVQETFVRALGGIFGFDASRSLRPWLLGIAANRCRTALRRRNRRPALAESVQECVDHRPGLADPDDLAGELERALGRLRPDYRMVFVLFHEQGLPYEEIAKVISGPSGRSRPGSIGPGPNWPTTSAGVAYAVNPFRASFPRNVGPATAFAIR